MDRWFGTVNVLFVCSRNKRRSLTAERCYARDRAFAVRSAGTADSARHRLSADDVIWADLIFAFETRHREQLLERFGGLVGNRTVIVLDIPDDYEFMEPELVEEIRVAVDAHLRPPDNA